VKSSLIAPELFDLALFTYYLQPEHCSQTSHLDEAICWEWEVGGELDRRGVGVSRGSPSAWVCGFGMRGSGGSGGNRASGVRLQV
jgi:hypothetical protein